MTAVVNAYDTAGDCGALRCVSFAIYGTTLEFSP